MSFGQNLQYLRKMHNHMTQEDLADKMGVSRQTISKWELDLVNPEIDKAVELCGVFSCTLDQLLREDMNLCNEAYSDIKVMEMEPFRYLQYAVISREPEDDAMSHVRSWAAACGIDEPELIGWDFPFVSQEQINVFHMHGYAAAWILPPDFTPSDKRAEVISQDRRGYAVITIKEPFQAPFYRIPNAYKTLMSYMRINGIAHREETDTLSCFEKVYEKDGVIYMNVYIAVESGGVKE